MQKFAFNCTLTDTVGSAKNKNHPKGGFDFWHGVSCNSRVDFIHDLLSFGKDVKKYFQNRVIVIL